MGGGEQNQTICPALLRRFAVHDIMFNRFCGIMYHIGLLCSISIVSTYISASLWFKKHVKISIVFENVSRHSVFFFRSEVKP